MFIHYGRSCGGKMKCWYGYFSKIKYIMRVYDYPMQCNDCVWIVPGTMQVD